MSLEERRMMRRPEVERVTGISTSTLYEMIKCGEFPVPVRLRRRAVGWPEAAVSEWLASRPTASVENWS